MRRGGCERGEKREKWDGNRGNVVVLGVKMRREWEEAGMETGLESGKRAGWQWEASGIAVRSNGNGNFNGYEWQFKRRQWEWPAREMGMGRKQPRDGKESNPGLPGIKRGSKGMSLN